MLGRVVYTSDYPIINVTVDIVVLSMCDGELCALAVKRGSPPHEGSWALPGGFVEIDEDLETAARRELAEETGVSGDSVRLEQLATYGAPDRDPRGRMISVAWLVGLADAVDPRAGSDASDARWRPIDWLLAPGRLAFDHDRILGDGVERARSKLEYTNIATAFVDDEFTIGELRRVYEVVWGQPLDPGNFHRKVTRTDGFVEATGKRRSVGRGRPAELFRAGPEEMLSPPLTRTSLAGGPAPGKHDLD
jgi:8-oxo-dGTP diphosphatase